MPVALGQVSHDIYDAAARILQNKQIETQREIALAQIRSANQRAALGAAENLAGMLNSNNQRAQDRQLQQQRDAQQQRLQQQGQRQSRLQRLLDLIAKENERWVREKDAMRQRGLMHNQDQELALAGIDKEHDELVDKINEMIQKNDLGAAEAVALQLQNVQQKRWKYAPRTPVPEEVKEIGGQKFFVKPDGNLMPIGDLAEKIKRDNEAHADRVATNKLRVTAEARDAFNEVYQTGGTFNDALDAKNEILTTNGLPPSPMARKAPSDPGYFFNNPSKQSVAEKKLDKMEDYLQKRHDKIMDSLRAEKNDVGELRYGPKELKQKFDEIWKNEGYKDLEDRVQRERFGQPQQTQPSVSQSEGDGISQDYKEARQWMEDFNAKRASGFRFGNPREVLSQAKSVENFIKAYETQNPDKFPQSQAAPKAATTAPVAQPQAQGVPPQAAPQQAPQAGQPPVQQADPEERAPGPFKGKVIGRETSSLSGGGLGGMAMMEEPLSRLYQRMQQAQNYPATSKSKTPDLAPQMGRSGQGVDDPRLIPKREFDRLVNETKKEVLAERTEAKNPISGLVSSEKRGLTGLPVDDAAITAEAIRRVKSDGYNFIPPTAGEKHFNEKMEQFSQRNPEPAPAIWRGTGETATRNLGTRYGNDQVVKNPAWEQWDKTRKQVADIARKEADKIEQKFQDWQKQQQAKLALSRNQRAGSPQNIQITLSPFAFVNEKTLRERTLKELRDAFPKALERQSEESTDGGRYVPGGGSGNGPEADQDRLRRNLETKMAILEDGNSRLTWPKFKDIASDVAGMIGDNSLSSQISDLGNWSKHQAPWTRPENLSSDGWDKLQQQLGKTGDFDSSQDLGKFLSPHYDKPGATQFGPSAGNKSAGLNNQDQIKVKESANGNITLENVAGQKMDVKNPEMDGVVTLFMVSGNGELPKKPERNADEALMDAKAKSIDLNSAMEELARTGWLPFDVRPQYENYPEWVDKLPAAKWIGKDGQEVRKNGISTTAKGIAELVDEASKSMEVGKYSPEAKAAEKAAQEAEQPAAEGDPNADQAPPSASVLSPEMQEHHLRTPKPPTKEAFEKGLRDNGFQPQPGEYEEYLQAREQVRGQLPKSADTTAPGNLFIDKDGKLKQSDGKSGKPVPKDQPLPPGYNSLVPQPNQQPFQGQPQAQRPMPLNPAQIEAQKDAEINAAADRQLKINEIMRRGLAPLQGKPGVPFDPRPQLVPPEQRLPRPKRPMPPQAATGAQRLRTQELSQPIQYQIPGMSFDTINDESGYRSPFALTNDSYSPSFAPSRLPPERGYAAIPLGSAYSGGIYGPSSTDYRPSYDWLDNPSQGFGSSGSNYSFPSLQRPLDIVRQDDDLYSLPPLSPLSNDYFPGFEYSPQPSYTPLFDNPGLYYENSPGYYAPGDYGDYSLYDGYV